MGHYQQLIGANLDQYRVEQKAVWENKTADNIRSRIKQCVVDELDAGRKEKIQERRERLDALLKEERCMYEQELRELSRPDPEKGKKEMAKKAYALKQKREEERKALVSEKLYQQWREGIDDLRTQDAKLFELQVTYDRGVQKDEKEEREFQERRENAIFDALWQEGYQAKIERELREKEMRAGLQSQMAKTLGSQICLKKK